jgi:hypothetical protein
MNGALMFVCLSVCAGAHVCACVLKKCKKKYTWLMHGCFWWNAGFNLAIRLLHLDFMFALG